MSRWPRARDIVNANRQFLETRARVQTDARRWHSDGKNPDLLLPAGKRLAEGEELLLRDGMKSTTASSNMSRRRRWQSAQKSARARAEGAARRETGAAIAAPGGSGKARTAGARGRAPKLGGSGGHAARSTHPDRGGHRAHSGDRGGGRRVRRIPRSAGGDTAGRTGRGKRQPGPQRGDAGARRRSAGRRAKHSQRETRLCAINPSRYRFSRSRLPRAARPRPQSYWRWKRCRPACPSPDRPYLLEAEAALYKALSEHRQTMVLRHDGGVTHAAFSPNGDRIVTASFDKTARIWNVEDGAEIAVLKGHQAVLETATFSPDGSRVATGARDGTARIWNAGSGEQMFVLDQPGDAYVATFSPDGTRLLTASYSSNPVVWDSQTGEKVATVASHTTVSATFSPDGRTFAACQGFERTCQIWSTEDGKSIMRIHHPGLAARNRLQPGWKAGFDRVHGSNLLTSRDFGICRAVPRSLFFAVTRARRTAARSVTTAALPRPSP